ncbi:MAG TPA: PEGA domain-containing protein [Kofleriaceae bacterium]
MTTGAPIYLVSACSSGEEFVAAFRRYADRAGLFVPIADPIPIGRKGRFALTLSDGSVMVEGDAEVISSARTPSVLHGRVGMTIRFTEPDAHSKTVLLELEKARLVPKPAAPSVPPRPANVPAAPRATPPAPGGRIDLHNARAECVAIGNLDTLSVVAAQAKPGGKFVVPTIPPVAGRPKSPSNPPFPVRTPPSDTKQPLPRTDAVPRVEPAFARVDSGAIRKATDPGMGSASESARFRSKTQAVAIVPPPVPVAPRGSITRPPPITARPELPTPTTTSTPPSPLSDTLTVPPIVTTDSPGGPMSDTVPAQHDSRGGPLSMTMSAVTPVERGYSETMNVALGDITNTASPLDLDDVIPPPEPVRPTFSPNDISGITAIAPPPKPESLVPVPQAEDLLTTIRTPRPQMDLLTTMRSSAPPMPPIVGTPPPALPELEIGEPTDLTVIPTAEDAQEASARRTNMGIAVVPGEATVLPAVTPPIVDPAHDPVRSARVMATPQVEEATPSGDWTMIPGAQGPTISPREHAPAPEPRRSERLTGDWSIQIDMDAPDGWSPPSKVEKIAAPPEPQPAPRRAAKLEPEPSAPAPAPVGPEEPKVQIDPTLIEPLQPLPRPDLDSLFATITPVPLAPSTMSSSLSPPHGVMPPHAVLPHSYPVQQQMVMPPVTAPHPAYPAPLASDSNASFFHEHVPRPQDSTSVTDIGRRRRYIVIGVSAAVVVAIGIALLVFLGIDLDDSEPTVMPVDKGSAPAVATPDAGAAAAVVPDAAIVAPPPEPPKVAAKCFARITSVPTGAEVAREADRSTILGKTPTKLELPCGEEVKLFVRKRGFVGEKRGITPTADVAKLEVAFQKNLLVVKVSSTPAGATIQMGNKNLGTTPGTIKLPAFEPSTITISKDGYQVESRKVVPKANNSTVHASLTKKRR